ncbi:MAG: hypothetical protein WBQ72_00910 [Terriglobales bacterium]|jgi:hypothetical protein
MAKRLQVDHAGPGISGNSARGAFAPHVGPDLNLALGSGSHARQTADIMVCFESLVVE